ncbi:hypothetical protein EPN52_08740 [bacterium]|nr:MAG: hypothetical protein EPN52_08740 [bacterium]
MSRLRASSIAAFVALSLGAVGATSYAQSHRLQVAQVMPGATPSPCATASSQSQQAGATPEPCPSPTP